MHHELFFQNNYPALNIYFCSQTFTEPHCVMVWSQRPHEQETVLSNFVVKLLWKNLISMFKWFLSMKHTVLLFISLRARYNIQNNSVGVKIHLTNAISSWYFLVMKACWLTSQSESEQGGFWLHHPMKKHQLSVCETICD